jgi:hypothetical protein
MKNKKLLFRNQTHELQAKKQIEQSITAMQTLINKYHEAAKLHDLSRLSNENLQEFISNIPDFIKSQLEATIEIPANINREKYLSMVDFPAIDTKEMEEIYNSIPIKHYVLYQIDKGIVSQNEAYSNEFIQADNIYIQEGSRKEAAYKALEHLCTALNGLRKISTMNEPFNTSRGFAADSLYTRRWNAEEHGTTYTIDKEKTVRFLSQILEA